MHLTRPELNEEICPRCKSTNVCVGSFVLSCLDCDWHYLNVYPCDVCGSPSYMTWGCSGGRDGKYVTYWVNRCRSHPQTEKDIIEQRIFWNTLDDIKY